MYTCIISVLLLIIYCNYKVIVIYFYNRETIITFIYYQNNKTAYLHQKKKKVLFISLALTQSLLTSPLHTFTLSQRRTVNRTVRLLRHFESSPQDSRSCLCHKRAIMPRYWSQLKSSEKKVPGQDTWGCSEFEGSHRWCSAAD